MDDLSEGTLAVFLFVVTPACIAILVALASISDEKKKRGNSHTKVNSKSEEATQPKPKDVSAAQMLRELNTKIKNPTER